MFGLQMVISTLALALILVGIWYEDKLIAFEDKVADYVCDRIGYILAQIVLHNKKLRQHFINKH